jgi:hypothetical protein
VLQVDTEAVDKGDSLRARGVANVTAISFSQNAIGIDPWSQYSLCLAYEKNAYRYSL